ncbi:MAG TPA: hypothetical protein VEW93_01265 [Acidimicrobiales bacterium]|nr:hypothetical protein [Acidimicrobiales bacterium]
MPTRRTAPHPPEPPAPRPGRRPPSRPGARPVVLLVALGLVLLGACSTIRVFTDFGAVLRDAGFGDVTVTIDSRGPSTLVVTASAPGGDTLTEAHDLAAELAWQRFPRRFEELRVTLDGERREHTRAQLEEAYGPRPAGLDETDLGDEVTRFGVTALVSVMVVGLVVMAGVAVAVVLVIRARRRRRPAQGDRPVDPPPPWPPPGPGPDDGPTPDDGETRHLGRRPRGPVPPASQVPPGWGP